MNQLYFDLLAAFFFADFFTALLFFDAFFFAVFLAVFFAADFFAADFFAADFFAADFFAGTLAPSFLASESAMAIACFRLVTFCPLPDFNFPFFFSCITVSTLSWAFLEYFVMVIMIC